MKKISNDEYYDLFIRWQASGKTKASFASEEGISRTVFYYWCKKFSEEESVQADGTLFSMITPENGFQREPIVKINFPSGVSIEFFGKVEIESLKNFI